jgi:hypothetical protein
LSSLFALKLGLLLFWAAWFAIVVLTNVFGVSKNYEAIKKAVSIYRAPPWVPRLLFAGVIAWQVVASALFAWAFASSLQAGALNMTAVNAAFAAGIGLMAAFMLADEITIKYAYEQAHELLFIAQIASLVALHAL